MPVASDLICYYSNLISLWYTFKIRRMKMTLQEAWICCLVQLCFTISVQKKNITCKYHQNTCNRILRTLTLKLVALGIYKCKSCLLSRTVEFDIEQTTCIPWHLISIPYGSLSFLTSSMCHALYNHPREFRRYPRDLHCEHGGGSVYSGLQSGLWGQDHLQCCHGDRGYWQNSTHHWHNHY